MKKILLKFVDFWEGFQPEKNFIMTVLSQRFSIELSDQPDYLIFSVFGQEHLNYDKCIKIFYTGENLTPDFNLCDYALGFDHLTLGDRYMRLPLYVAYDIKRLSAPKVICAEEVLNRKFCSFVVSNGEGATQRNRFFELLSAYKQVDSGGGYKNNIGGRVKDKVEFIKNYKFNIAFENSAYDGYTTEKIMEPMFVNSIPIYWGNRLVGLDFNPGSFVNVNDFPSLEKAVEYIIYLDTHDDAYLAMLSNSWFNSDNYLDWEQRLLAFFDVIFGKPMEAGKYIPAAGYSEVYRSWLRLSVKLIKKRENRKWYNPSTWF